jgi:hypothetical protein
MFRRWLREGSDEYGVLVLMALAAIAVMVVTALAVLLDPPVAHASAARSQNFTVRTNTNDQAFADQVARSAERYRTDLAVSWLGKPLGANWYNPCDMRVTCWNGGNCGQTDFVFSRGEVFGWSSSIKGEPARILDSVLPHEVTHMVMASHFRCPLPRWADEGMASSAEAIPEKQKVYGGLLQALSGGYAYPIDRMMVMMEYPRNMRDVGTFYAEGNSLVEFLVSAGGRQKFVNFLWDSMRGKNWTNEVQRWYGFPTLPALQVAWLASVQKQFCQRIDYSVYQFPQGYGQCQPGCTTCLPGQSCPVPVLRPTGAASVNVGGGGGNYVIPYRRNEAAADGRLEAGITELRGQMQQLLQQNAQGQAPAAQPLGPLVPVVEPPVMERPKPEGPKTIIGKAQERVGEFIEAHGGPISSRLAAHGTENLEDDSVGVRFKGFTQVGVAILIFCTVIAVCFALLVRVLHKIGNKVLPKLAESAAKTPNTVDDKVVSFLQGINDRVGKVETQVESHLPDMSALKAKVDSALHIATQAAVAAVPAAAPLAAAVDAIKALQAQHQSLQEQVVAVAKDQVPPGVAVQAAETGAQ